MAAYTTPTVTDGKPTNGVESELTGEPIASPAVKPQAAPNVAIEPTNRQARAAIGAAAGEARSPSGRRLEVISLAAAMLIAAETRLTLDAIYRFALEEGICPLCYTSNIGILSLAEQLILANSHIAIVGAGGLGGGSAMLFARLGIGKMTIIDGDSFEESNGNRQLFCLSATLGKKKAAVVAAAVARINPAVVVKPHSVKITDENAEALLAGALLVVDALDNIPSRLVVAAAAEKMNIPFIHGAAAGFVGQIASMQAGVPLTNIYPQNYSLDAALGAPSVLSFTPMLVASLQAATALQVLLDRKTVLAKGLLHINLHAGIFRQLCW